MTEIRIATDNDIRKLAVLFDEYRVFYKYLSAIENAQKFLSDRLKQKDSVIYVAVNEQNHLVGFVQLYPLFSSTKMKRLWLLNDLYVAEDFRGKGISKQLIESCKQLCKETNACGLMLETAVTNNIGNALYQKTGFVQDKEHHYYYWNN